MLEALIAWQEDPQRGDEEDTFFSVVEVVEDGDDYVLTITGRDARAERASRWRVRAHQVLGVQLNLPEAVSPTSRFGARLRTRSTSTRAARCPPG